MRSMVRCAVRLAAWSALLAGSLPAQEDAPPSTIDVFLDCNTFFCDFNHFRREIAYVNWVRNREDADVHILITARQTGGGGWELTFAFLGRGVFEGRDNTLQHVSDRTDTRTEVRDAMTRVLGLGLVAYVAATPSGERLEVVFQAPEAAAPAATTPAGDPWNFWVFSISARGSFNGESQQRFLSGNGSISASRTTDALKLSFRVNARHSRSEFDVVDTTINLDTTFISTRTSYSLSQLAVWSLGARWSLGFETRMSASTFLNQDLAFRGGPAVEYNIFPYDESTRHLLTVKYMAGIAAFDYDQVTIFDRTSEVRPSHELQIGLNVQQPWGSVFTSITASQFLHDLAKHNVNLFGSLNFRVVRGLDLNVFANVARIKDQLFIASEGLTTEEILLRQRQLGTDFRYNVSIGLTYRFGSKFANIVNPRMGGGGRFFFFF